MMLISCWPKTTNSIKDAITRLLEQAGAKVWLAGNGEEALRLMRHMHFDCVLMDVQMPIMNRHEATRLIRSTKAFADFFRKGLLVPSEKELYKLVNGWAEDCLACSAASAVGAQGIR